MVMKMHSYITVNGELQLIESEGKSLFSQLKSATEPIGGWDKAIEVASAKQAEEQAKMTAPSETVHNSKTDMEPTPIGTPSIPEGLSTSYLDAKTANALRKRLAAISHAQSSGTSISSSSLNGESYRPGPGNFNDNTDLKTEKILQSNDTPEPRSYVVEGGEDHDEDLKPHVLVYHPDEKISALANEYSDLQSDLVSSGPNHVRWEDTITWTNFALYQLTPTLVYELEYPRTDRLVFIFAALGILSLLLSTQHSASLRIRENRERRFRCTIWFFFIAVTYHRSPLLGPSLFSIP
jgi:sterol O-acyltransferase